MKKLIFVLNLLVALNVSAKDKRPNILFVFSDDHATHAIGAYNGWLKAVNPTPEIDKLAKEIAGYDKKLANESFLAKAPHSVVAEQQDRRRKASDAKAKLENALGRLSSA